MGEISIVGPGKTRETKGELSRWRTFLSTCVAVILLMKNTRLCYH